MTLDFPQSTPVCTYANAIDFTHPTTYTVDTTVVGTNGLQPQWSTT